MENKNCLRSLRKQPANRTNIMQKVCTIASKSVKNQGLVISFFRLTWYVTRALWIIYAAQNVNKEYYIANTSNIFLILKRFCTLTKKSSLPKYKFVIIRVSIFTYIYFTTTNFHNSLFHRPPLPHFFSNTSASLPCPHLPLSTLSDFLPLPPLSFPSHYPSLPSPLLSPLSLTS